MPLAGRGDEAASSTSVGCPIPFFPGVRWGLGPLFLDSSVPALGGTTVLPRTVASLRGPEALGWALDAPASSSLSGVLVEQNGCEAAKRPWALPIPGVSNRQRTLEGWRAGSLL